MNILHLQEQQLYKQLQPVFNTEGYVAIPDKKQFRKPGRSGFKNIIFSMSGDEEEQIINVHIGLRFDLVEELVCQFLNIPESVEKESNTVIASLSRFHRLPYHRFIVTDDSSLQQTCEQIERFMKHKGFRFLNAFEKLKRIDAVVNRKPALSCPYMYNQIHRCFKGITIARLLHRTDFEQLVTIYSNYLYSQWAPRHLIENFEKLVNYLRHFSLN